MKPLFVIAGLAAILALSVTDVSASRTEIRWDQWGVPHITAKTEPDVYYAFGWAQMEAHGNKILRLYAGSRGRSSEYWGAEGDLAKDILVRKLDIPERADRWLGEQPERTKRNITAFVRGMNAWCKDHPASIEPRYRKVLPVLDSDPLAQLQVSYHLSVGAFALQAQADAWKSSGSNAWAIAPKRSASRNAMLLVQPHPPWTDEYRFFEAHLMSRGLNVYGVTLLGLPSIAMGFNEDLGWAMTFNQADAMDLIELEVRNDEYRTSGGWKKFDVSEENVANRDGETVSVTVKRSDYGYVVKEADGKALALRLSGLDRPFLTGQLADMARARSAGEFNTALRRLQLPLQNIIYADRGGNISYLFNGIIPRRPVGSFSEWAGIIPSTKDGALVKDYLAYDELPRIENPPSGFVANSNNDPWSSTFPFELDPSKYAPYLTARPFGNFDLRSVESIKLLNKNPKLSLDDVEALQGSTRSELADRVLDELIAFGNASQDPQLKQVAEVLSRWDREFGKDSKGAVLFANWYFAARKGKIFADGFSAERPLDTPSQLTTEAKSKLADAAAQTLRIYGRLDIEWGDAYQTKFNGKQLRGGLGLGELGSFNAGFYSRGSGGKWELAGGAAFTAAVEFGKRVRAKGLLSYGNFSGDVPLFVRDQLQMMIDRKLRDIVFYLPDIKKSTRHIERLDPAR